MKHDDRRKLLDDLYHGGEGPPVDQVLERLRQDRTVRSRRNLAVVASVIVLGVGTSLTAFWKAPVKVVSPAVQVTAVQTPEKVERISDEELLAAMGRPAALVTLPDGRQSVLYLAPVAQRQ